MEPSIGINPFCAARHGPDSEGTAYLKQKRRGGPDWAYLTDLVAANFNNRKPGYTDGVVIVQIPVTDISGDGLFSSPTVDLEEGDFLVGTYKARVEGETPRKQVQVRRVGGGQNMARYCFAVLYSREKLAEKDETRTGNDWDVITLLGSMSNCVPPMPPQTLMANHFGDSGGSSTNMTPEQFEAALRESYAYWRGRANVTQ